METGRIYEYLAKDHGRLDDALRRITADPERIDREAYREFREGLLRHIGMEEKILLPAARAAQSGTPIAAAAILRLHHAALAALLVLSPTTAIVDAIRTILHDHNPLEEGPGGVYQQCEQLIGAEANDVLIRLQNAPPVALAKNVDSDIAVESARLSLARAGYNIVI